MKGYSHMQYYAVIMAGGGGTRFWPLSRQQMPKQLLNISGNDVMINESIKRIADLIPLSNIFVVTNRKQKDIINELLLNDLPRENILFEPVGRNTAACIAFAAMTINSRCPDAVMCVLPSDHHIGDEDGFRRTIRHAGQTAEETGKLITIGIKPTFPATGYGYIKYEAEDNPCCNGAYEVTSFVEKPDIERAREYQKQGNYLWNSGMFVWKVSTILENMMRYLPRLYKAMSRIREYIGSKKEEENIESVYKELQSISIDFGIMERSDDVLVIPGSFGWNDVGSWDSLGTIFPTDDNGNIIKARHIALDTRNSIIYSNDRLVATIGLEDIIVADTPDALLICPKSKAQDVKSVVDMIKRQGLEEYI